jgi:hypothetical protein
VLGVEPDVQMVDLARRSGLEIDVTTFEAWDPAGRTFDAVLSWHAESTPREEGPLETRRHIGK